MIRPSLLLLLAFVLPSLAPADELTRSAEPDWVAHTPWSPTETTNAEGDYEDLLKDVQVNRVTRELYIRYAYRILTPQAVQDSASFSIEYDPSYQKVRLHTLTIWRNGAATNQLSLTFRSLQREKDLDNALYDAKETWVGFLKNVRPGDILEAAYTIAGENPIFRGRYADDFRMETGYAVDLWNLRLLAPKGRTPEVRTFGTDRKPVVSEKAGLVETVWTLKALDSLRYDDGAPVDARQGPRLVFSDWRTWNEVVTWALPEYRPQVDADVRALAAELIGTKTEPSQKAQALLQYVQDQIRYLGIEVGAHSHFPHPPAEVLLNGFGDCKDKAVLFVSLAAAAGIKAWPVLVNTDRGTLVSTEGPTPLAFNHVIAALELPGGTKFVDPTLDWQGDTLETQGLGAYVFGLELREGVTALTPLPGWSPGTRSLVQDFWFDSYDGLAKVDVEYTFTGSDAAYQRSRWSGIVVADWKKEQSERLHDDYGEASLTSDPVTSDDRSANVFKLKYSFDLPLFWKKKNGKQEAYLYPSLVRPLLYDPDSVAARTMPYSLEHPVTVTQTARVHVPSDWTLTGNDTVDGPGFRVVNRTSMINPRLIEIHTEYSSTADRVHPAQWQTYLDALDDARNALGWSLTFTPEVAANTSNPTGVTALGIVATATLFFLLSVATQGGDF